MNSKDIYSSHIKNVLYASKVPNNSNMFISKITNKLSYISENLISIAKLAIVLLLNSKMYSFHNKPDNSTFKEFIKSPKKEISPS